LGTRLGAGGGAGAPGRSHPGDARAEAAPPLAPSVHTLRGRVVSRVGDVTRLITEISASVREQANGLKEVNIAVNRMDQITQQNAAMVEESTAASHAMRQEAEQLGSMIRRFRISDDAGQDSYADRYSNVA
jgi:hypothetical protein